MPAARSVAKRTSSDVASREASRHVEAEHLPFTVASALLRELGERLVGQSHIALAELIKNSYDADASRVLVTVNPDEIIVEDDGHGMTYAQFRDYWMRIGSPHKGEMATSPSGRALTGSKGVGRLAAQFLATDLSLATCAGSNRQLLEAQVDWEKAVRVGDLTQASARVTRSRRRGSFVDGAPHGTRLRLTGLKEEWQPDALRLLARELWPLRPPFRGANGKEVFDIQLSSQLEDAEVLFEDQMKAILEIWDARVTGRILPLSADPSARPGGPRTLQVAVELGGQVSQHRETLATCSLDSLTYEIRVFDLRNRQPAGIRVSTAREYLNAFGGVHVYDAGFHLPYYGADTDWLAIEQEHAHRLARSKLLPEELHYPNALNFLPTNSRLYGVVRVDTGHERKAAPRGRGPGTRALTITLTRDRLVNNAAFRDLRDAVRFGVDFYTSLEARKHAEEVERLRPSEALPVRIARVEELLDAYEDSIPASIREQLRRGIRDVLSGVRSEAELVAERAGLLGALATAGISALAFEHEFGRQLAQLEDSTASLRDALTRGDGREALGFVERVEDAIAAARDNRRIFGSMLEEEDRSRRTRPRATPLLEEALASLGPLARGIEADFDDLDDVRLPRGTQAEWAALWQNVMVNAINAMLDVDDPWLRASVTRRGRVISVRLEDNGVGVDLNEADRLFEPFNRMATMSRERRGLGFGGSGLGLTIVRMIGDSLNCQVRFVRPSEGFRTAFQLSWHESS